MGAYLSDMGPRIPTIAGARIAGSVYNVPVLHLQVRCMFTNTTPTDAYRGAGRPEICYTMERLLDAGADELGIGREEIRRRNFIAVDELPYTSPIGMVIDSGDFTATQDMALANADWAGFEKRRDEARARGKLRGIGLGYYIEASGGQPTEWARVRFESDNTVSLIVGTFSHGQGHETAYAQIASEKLGVPFEDFRLIQGDSDIVEEGNGTGGSRSSQMGGVAISRSCEQIVEAGKPVAARLLQSEPDEVAFEAGHYRAGGASTSIAEVAQAAREADANTDSNNPGLDESCLYKRSTECNFPNGCHICEVEIDPDTGTVDVVRYIAVDDCGVIINPMLVAGQVHGGVAQGLGQALLENTAYDPESGQFIAGSFMDYCMPRADDFPNMDVDFNVVPNPSNDLGVKGIGEGGSCGAPSAIVSAVADALKHLGVRHIDMPVTSEKVWRAMNQGRAAAE
jgi:carbon-monoxide dehydrogenase large subunit